MKKIVVLLAVVMCSAVAFAGSVSINLNDAGYTVVTNQYLSTDGVTFSNSLELTTGDGDIGTGMDYPLPPNGSNVITNDPADPMTLSMTGTFTGTGALAGNYVYSLSFYYTSPIGATVTAYNINGQVLTTLTLGANNGASTLATLTVPGCTGASWSAACTIAYVTFSDGGAPDTLTIGELTLTDAATPEPGTLAMFGSGLLGLVCFLRYRTKLGNAAKRSAPALLALMFCVFVFTGASQAATEKLITQPIDENDRVTLTGNTRPDVHNSKLDMGKLSDDYQMGHLLLQLKRSPAHEAALEKYLDEIQDPNSPHFHHYMDAKVFASRWGASQDDIDVLVSWLQGHGFKIEGLFPATMAIGFTGTASQLKEAFGVEEHMFQTKGRNSTANVNDPSIPVALVRVVEGVVGLSAFLPSKHSHKFNPSNFYTGSADFPQAVVPNDLETIYNANPLFAQGLTGAGQTIVVVEDTNVYNPPTGCTVGSATCQAPPVTGDMGLFRNVMGLTKYNTLYGANVIFNQLNPASSPNGPFPNVTCGVPSTVSGAGTGVNADAGEAAIDVEYAGSLAPGANIVNAACADTGNGGEENNGAFGGMLALENIVNLPGLGTGSFPTCPAITLTTTAGTTKVPACVVSMSYGITESFAESTVNAAFNTAFQTAVGEGISAFASSGDNDAVGNVNTTAGNNGGYSAVGLNVTGWGSSQYVLSVGGTDFGDTACGAISGGCANFVGTSATYWNNYNNVWYGSARSYIPEIPWNNSCAGVLLSEALGTTVPPTGASSACNVTADSAFRSFVGGAGGPSTCATGTPSAAGDVGGSCAGWAKPSYQASNVGVIPGIPNDQVRDLPDISAFAANGLWGHLLPACFSGTFTNAGGATCGTVAAPTRPIPVGSTCASGCWWIGGGTSFSSPIMAGVQALVNQFKQQASGQPHQRYYALAANGGSINSGPYGSSVSNCNSSLGDTINSGCIFHDSTLGDMDSDCEGTLNCYIPSSTRGVSNTGAVTSVTTQPKCTGCTTATTFSCSVAGPSNLGPYKTANGVTTLYSGGVQSTCSVTSNASSTLTMTITAGGAGYVTNPVSTVAITGGPGTMSAQAVVKSTVSATTGYQPAFATNPGYDLATGLGSINAYNLVHNY